MKLLELHVIQTVAPSNLNRDDTGSPKDTLFGGYRRARISSQAQKRAVRTAFREDGLLSGPERAVRTRRLVDELARRLEGTPKEKVRHAVANALNALGLGVNENGLTEYLLFLGNAELDRLAELISQNLEELAAVETKRKKQATIDKELQNGLERVLDGGKAVDLALFGRMVADRPNLGVDAAAQVAHGISTHEVDREFDFYTAVDDLNPREETGAGMMGDVEFCSATLYRYAVVDLDKLAENLQGDKELALKGALAFLRAFALTLPTGKQNSFAAHNPPLFIACRVGEGAPRSLATAFEKPVRRGYDKTLSAQSVKALEKQWSDFDRAFGPLKDEWRVALDLTGAEASLVPRIQNFEELVRGAQVAIQRLLG